jgi:hypothetical protein
VGVGIRRKEADINDFKTYSLGNFKNLSVLFMTASFVSSVIFWGYLGNIHKLRYYKRP